MSYGLHQSFHIRDGWLRKGMRAIETVSNTYWLPETAEELGLGVNMVEALRFWMRATGLAAEESESRGKSGGARRVQKLTEFGRLVLERDPYLEMDTTLWLVHYHLVGQEEPASAWYWFFNLFGRPVFDRTKFLEELGAWATGPDGKAPSQRTLEGEFEVFVKTYLPSGKDASPEDTLDCPLSILGLLEFESSRKRYRLLRPELGRLNPVVVLYVMQRWQEEHHAGKPDVDFSDVLRGSGNAGRVFGLDAVALSEVFAQLSEEAPELKVGRVRTAGLNMVMLPPVSADELLQRLFGSGKAR